MAMSHDSSELVWGFALMFGIPALVIAGPSIFLYLALIGAAVLFAYLAALGLGFLCLLIPATKDWGMRWLGRASR